MPQSNGSNHFDALRLRLVKPQAQSLQAPREYSKRAQAHRQIIQGVILAFFLLWTMTACISVPASPITTHLSEPSPISTTTPSATTTPTQPAKPEPTIQPSHTLTSTSLPSPTTEPTQQPTIHPTQRSENHRFPDSEIVYSPNAADFDVIAYLDTTTGFLREYRQYLMITGWISGGEIVELVALENSINPRLLLALLEFHCGCVLTTPDAPDTIEPWLGAEEYYRHDLYGQLIWAVHQLSDAYYGWQTGTLTYLSSPNGTIVDISPETNAGTVALQNVFFNRFSTPNELENTLSAFLTTYQMMFGDPFSYEVTLIPEGLTQPTFQLPFEPGKVWGMSGGPHPAFEGSGPWASLDFAPPAVVQGCFDSPDWVTAVAEGVIVRSEFGIVVQDLDMDGVEHTGWNVMYLHIADKDRVPLGEKLSPGDRIGHPSCEGGRATGTHLHLARKYNGQWIAADGPIPFVLSGWVAHNGEIPYKGTLTHAGTVITASTSSARSTWIQIDE
jgi:hypothetical protein